MLLLFLTTFSCAKTEEDDSFAFELVGSTFRVSQYRELEVTSNWFQVTGNQDYVIEDNSIRIDYQSYQETSPTLCSGSVEYTYELLSEGDFETQLISASSVTSDFEETPYSIFTIYDKFLEDEGDDSSDIQSTEEGEDVVVNNISYYISATIVSNNVSVDCPIIQPGNLLLFLKLFKNGDLEVVNFNREVRQLSVGI